MASIKNRSARFALFAAAFSVSLIIPFFSGLKHARAETLTAEASTLETVEELRAANVEETAKLEKFDGRNYGIVTPVKDQGSSNLCWAYAAVSASETSVLRSGIDNNATHENLSLSPEELGYRRHNREADPLGNTDRLLTEDYGNWLMKSGDPSYGASVFSQWCGPIKNSLAVTSDPYENAEYRFQNALHIDFNNARDLKIAAIKRAIAQYGAVTYSYNNLRETEYYNPVNESGSGSYPHACTLIGWDDTIPAEKFVPGGAKRNGGWLVKNSYLSLPYFYLSYDNDSSAVYAFDYASKEEYDFNYFYDNEHLNSPSPSKNITRAANVFEAKKGGGETAEYVKAVNIGLQGKNVSCSVKIYTGLTDLENPESGTLAGGGSAVLDFAGYRTVKLDSPVKVEKGDCFGVVVEISNENNNARINWAQQINGRAKSFVFSPDGYWYKSKFPVRIKAFTALEEDDGSGGEPPLRYDIKDCSVTVDGDFIYTGTALTPSVTVSLNGLALISGEDYTLEYSDNVNAGTAKVIINGCGNFYGIKSVDFIIDKAEKPPSFPPDSVELNWNENLSDKVWAEGWRLSNPYEILEPGESKTVTLIYRDILNYEIFTAAVKVTKKSAPVSPEEPDTPELPDVPEKPPEEIIPPLTDDTLNTGDAEVKSTDIVVLTAVIVTAVIVVSGAVAICLVFIKRR